ncbi:uncharacterized protein K452DRAFT_303687 [Aplosporella prunicola CBS 121167]|uniref:Uncharacterized protein n=1 Tax=Aplosporella prunicola CBS 121167 TaxID=1176127 RepID=A0A6A6AXF9_9PEZI|nr:uncharacterized protein K452DRAFT_303687 [Aplosporella prunicola CBS 121167]KAF2135241.1 hypothetical protein K452DRAFT_303687 [Aplosporella prunicola CBS 121167]
MDHPHRHRYYSHDSDMHTLYDDPPPAYTPLAASHTSYTNLRSTSSPSQSHFRTYNGSANTFTKPHPSIDAHCWESARSNFIPKTSSSSSSSSSSKPHPTTTTRPSTSPSPSSNTYTTPAPKSRHASSSSRRRRRASTSASDRDSDSDRASDRARARAEHNATCPFCRDASFRARTRFVTQSVVLPFVCDFASRLFALTAFLG